MTLRTLAATAICTLGLAAVATLTGCATTNSTDDTRLAATSGDAFANAIRSGSIADAQAKASEQGKMLLVFGTASWCGPCQRMKATTWTDQRVINWTRNNAVIYYLDGDEHPDARQSLDINAYPTVIAFRGRQEVDRLRGGRNPDDFMQWLNEL
jgi:protein disulfide-isomerase